MGEGKYRAEIYRQRAMSIRYTAELAVDETTREDLLRLADSWDRLAQRKFTALSTLTSTAVELSKYGA